MTSEKEKNFSLLVQGKTIPCSQAMISNCSVFSDLVMFTSTQDTPSPIPVPEFITRQVVLDLLEVVERGDLECAHLVLVSLSYLLDFLRAVDFLGCQQVKTGVEELVRQRITELTWRPILKYSKHIPGLLNTSRDVVQFLCKRLASGAEEKGNHNQEALMSDNPKEGLLFKSWKTEGHRSYK
jgi:hypothetical protein